MITIEVFAYSEPEWDAVKTVIRDALGLDADQIDRRITRLSITGMQPLRHRIEVAVGLYQIYSASTRPRRAKLIALRKNTENLKARIIDALAVQIGTKYDLAGHPTLRPGVDQDMLGSTNDCFATLLRTLDRQIERAGQRQENASKTKRDECWGELLAIWCELGGKPSGAAAARFLAITSKPMMATEIPADIRSVVQWLERRRKSSRR